MLEVLAKERNSMRAKKLKKFWSKQICLVSTKRSRSDISKTIGFDQLILLDPKIHRLTFQ